MVQVFQIFQDLVAELEGKLTINGHSEDLLHQSLAQESIYKLYFSYMEENMCIEYVLGATHYAAIAVFIESDKKLPEFEITTRTPFMSLFKGKKNRVQIKSEDKAIREKIESNPSFIELSELSANTRFVPYTFGKSRDLGYEMKTEYHLEFSERTQELKPLIQFHKDLIDILV